MDEATKVEILKEVYTNLIYVAGSAFVAGSCVTLLALLLLDFMRRNKEKRKNPSAEFPPRKK